MTFLACRGARLLACLAAAVSALAGCTPALNWRDVRPAGSGLLLQLPCKPAAQQRQVPLAGPPVRLELQACNAAGQTWGLAFADVADPARVGPALTALLAAAAANVGASAGAAVPLAVPGATPSPHSGQLQLQGRLPDGTPVKMQVLVFAHGTTVFQASVLGERLAADAVEAYFASLRLGR